MRLKRLLTVTTVPLPLLGSRAVSLADPLDRDYNAHVSKGTREIEKLRKPGVDGRETTEDGQAMVERGR